MKQEIFAYFKEGLRAAGYSLTVDYTWMFCSSGVYDFRFVRSKS